MVRWRNGGARRAGFVRAFTAVLLLIFFAAPLASSQQATIFYVYDDLNRLIAVVNQQGDVGFYVYDAVGNILRIERFDVSGLPGPVGISLFTPPAGKVGTTVQIFGKGFDPSPAANTVRFNGTPATVTAAAPNRLVAEVPMGAATGPISVSAPLGSATSAKAFRVVGALAISPTSATVIITRTQQFEAQTDGAPISTVTWSVNGITGGDPSVGMISADGLYTAPVTVPTPGAVTITATDSDDRSVAASATVQVILPPPTFVAGPPVSVVVSAPATVDHNVAATLTVRIQESGATAAFSGVVTVQVEPVVLAISPATTPAGSTLTVTVTGRGFGEASALDLLRDNAVDPDISVNNLVVAPDGTQATADITIAAGAVTGVRVVRITTPAGSSTAAGTGGNLFTVQ